MTADQQQHHDNLVANLMRALEQNMPGWSRHKQITDAVVALANFASVPAKRVCSRPECRNGWIEDDCGGLPGTRWLQCPQCAAAAGR